MSQLDGHDRCLDCVQSKVSADHFVEVLRFRAVNSQDSKTLRSFWIIGDDHASVTGAAKIFGWKEAEAAVVSDGAGTLSLVFRSDGLGGVFDDDQIVLFRDVHNGGHIGHLAEQVDRDDCFCSRSDLLGNQVGVDVKSVWIDVDKDRRCTKTRNATRCGEEAVSGGDDFVAGADVFGHQRNEKCVGA